MLDAAIRKKAPVNKTIKKEIPSVLIKLQFLLENAFGFIVEAHRRKRKTRTWASVSDDWLEIQLIKIYFDH